MQSYLRASTHRFPLLFAQALIGFLCSSRKRSSENPRGDRRCLIQHPCIDAHVQRAEPAGLRRRDLVDGGQEALLLGRIDDTVGQGGELVAVLLAGEGTSPQRMRVGDGEFVGDDLAVLEGDLRAGTERLFGRILGVVAPRPLRILDRGDLAPEVYRVGTV